ncbi:MAG: DegQ family serine endoprotease [Planctomycetaceae bacterium]
MKSWSRGIGLLLTLATGITLGVAAVALSQPQNATKLVAAPLHTPSDLSLAFRTVSEHALPAVVSITSETESHRVEMKGGNRQMSPQQQQFLEELFGNDPRFGDMFGEGGERYVPPRQGTGSGVIVDPSGIVLTNSHVVEGADRVTVTLSDGREIVAESWNYDPRSDVAIVRISAGEPLPSLALADSDGTQVGDWVLALGNPFNVGTTVTAGIVSARGRGPGINEREDYIQTDAAINPGNSGGPLVDLAGNVVGINTAISSRSGGYDGIGFAIPSNMVRWVADQLIKSGEVRRSYLGVQLQPITEEIRESLGIARNSGALVNKLFPDTPADKAGIQVGDVILKFGKDAIADQSELVDIVEKSPAGKSYPVTVQRGGKEMLVDVTLELMPSDYTPALQRLKKEESNKYSSSKEVGSLGLEISNLTPNLAENLGIPEDTQGVVVRGVKDNSPAARAALQPGDIIQRVGQTPVNSLEEFGSAIEKANSEKGILLYIRRGDSGAFVVLK